MNRILLTGHLGADPKLAEATNREKYCHFSLATDEYWKDPAGQLQRRTEWHSVFFWGPRVDTLATLIRKGSKILVEGRLESRPDPEAKSAPRRIWSVKGLRYELLDRRADGAVQLASGTGADSTDDGSNDDVPL